MLPYLIFLVACVIAYIIMKKAIKVADKPLEKKNKVFNEITRPTSSVDLKLFKTGDPNVTISEPSPKIIDAEALEESYELKVAIKNNFPDSRLEIHNEEDHKSVRLIHPDGNVVAVAAPNVFEAIKKLATQLGVTRHG